MDSLALAQIEHFDGVVAERANEQSLPRSIECEMVDATFDFRQWERLRQFKCSLLGAGSSDADPKRDKNRPADKKRFHLLA